MTILWAGCSDPTTLISAVSSGVDLAVNLWDRNEYVTKDCLWYQEVNFSPEMKAWIIKHNPPQFVIDDLGQVAENNDLYKEICEKMELPP
uniref:Uncharacterized protein n=1 Tax=uncultured marine virus TaxID=186617 RepID=A0A0F7L8L6_9VIRU|nr:hypothetical protein [uncultured marine virus]